ncbi:MAG: hypothetical protein IT168_32765 [Bryobacterales bacterium]|nr:hypothetical protein [Bryobacterales bacterium]
MTSRLLSFLLISSSVPLIAQTPSMIGYSMFPNRYVDDHAPEIKKIYDGFFYSAGTWENARDRFEGASPKDQAWLDAARKNIAALRAAGATENFLTVAFGQDAAWPSPETLLGKEYTATMAAEFGALARVAKSLGFRGLCIDVEYPFPRYELDHAVYTYKGYTAADLIAAARNQGRGLMKAILKEFPNAVIWNLPGDAYRTRPIGRELSLGMLDAMAEVDAPGGMHQGTEFTYSLNEAVTHLATARFEDVAMHRIASPKTAAYWRKRCTMAPGAWPLHMVETEVKHYPIQPWKDEMRELTEQMGVLRAASKRYIWSYSGNPVWYVHTPEIEAKYGLKKQDLKREDIDLKLWHGLLKSKRAEVPAAIRPLLAAVKAYDRGELSGDQLCQRFGTPAKWWVLGYVSHVLKVPQFTAEEALAEPNTDPHKMYTGRDQAVRWFQYDALDPRGFVNPRYVFDYHKTDAAGAHFRTYVQSPTAREAVIHIGWDDIVTIRLNETVIFDTRNSDKTVKGATYLDRYLFEKTFPIQLKQGSNRLEISSYNSHGVWVFATRITGKDNIPFADLRFMTAE